jgi:membrane-associated phospholipid phosphatase
MSVFIHSINSLDVSIYYFLSRFAGNYFLYHLVTQKESNYLFKGEIFLSLCWYLWFRNLPDKGQCRRAIMAIMIGAVLSIIVTRIIAFIAQFRVRPVYHATLAHGSYSIPVTADIVNWSSFPSDTAAYFFALAFGLAYLSRRLAIPIILYTAAWVCLPRMYLGLHYASDIVVGAAIGITTVWVSLRSELLQAMVARRLLSAMETTPEWFYAIAFLVSIEMATVFEGFRHAGNSILHSVLFGLLGYKQSGPFRPIDAWGA